MNLKIKRIVTGSLLILAVILITGVFTIRYLVTQRLREIIQLVVKNASNDRYTLESSDLEFSFSERRINILNTDLLCRDTSAADHYYQVRIDALHLSIESWKELLLNKRLEVTSFIINHPRIKSVDKRIALPTGSSEFHLNTIVQPLQDVLRYLSVKQFSVINGDFELSSPKRQFAYHGEGLNFRIINFQNRDKDDHRFLFADDVDLLVRKQSVTLPNGKIKISTGRLHFSGARQFFEVDSLAVRSTSTNQHQFNFTTNQVGFKSSDLTSAYEKEEIKLDSVWVHQPRIVMEKSPRSSDSMQAVHQTAHALMASMRMGFVSIIGGTFQLDQPGSRSPVYQTNMVDLRLRDLEVDRSTRKVTAGSIEISQKNMMFTTPDSMYQLEVGEFVFRNNELELRNAHYYPTASNHTNKALEFTTPVLKLSKVRIEDLLIKHLRASTADLERPSITITSPTQRSAPADATATAAKSDLFFKTLKSLHELIRVDSFRIHQGNLTTINSGNQRKILSMQSLESIVLLNRFFESNSMFKIKKSMPELSIGRIQVHGLHNVIMLEGYRLQGILQHNHADRFSIVNDNGSSIHGNDITWELLDWDELQLNNKIRVEKLSLGSIDAEPVIGRKTEKPAKKPMPDLSINDLSIATLRFQSRSASLPLQFMGAQLALQKFHTVDNHFEWQSIGGRIEKLQLQDSVKQVEITSIDVSDDGHHEARDVKVEVRQGSIRIPVLAVNLPLRSSDFSNPQLKMLRFEHAVGSVSINNKGIEFPDINVEATNLVSLKDPAGKLIVAGGVSASVNHLNYEVELKDSSLLRIRDIGAKLHMPIFKSNELSVPILAEKTIVTTGPVDYRKKDLYANIEQVGWNIRPGVLQLKQLSIMPTRTMEETFELAGKQVDYMQVKAGSIDLVRPGVKRSKKKLEQFTLPLLLVEDLDLETTKDKRLPFEKGHPKPMFTDIARKLKIPFTVDTILLRNSHVTIHEISPKTKRKGTIPLESINALVTNFSNQAVDSLYITASLKLFNNYVTAFEYKESYSDSLAGFRLNVKTSKMNLNEYSSITVPVASADILRGSTEGLQARWRGNRYAAVGVMQFPYQRLKVRLLDDLNPDRKTFMLSVKNFLANSLLLKNSNSRESMMFFVRDQDRSVFNFWVKTKLSGVVSSAVRTKNKSTKKKYLSAKDKYHISL